MSTVISALLRKPNKSRKKVHLSSIRLRNTTQNSNLLTWQDLPDWQKDNEYILTGYRRAQYNWRGCFLSVFAYLHNETVNIHTHLWGTLLFCYILFDFPSIATVPDLPPSRAWVDTLVIPLYLWSAICCFSFSTIFHIFVCHSNEICERCNALDYGGIVVLIVGTTYPYLYYGFFCHPSLMACYLSLITILGLGAAYTVLNPEYAKPSHLGTRTAVFVGVGWCATMPVFHLISILGLETVLSDLAFNWLIVSCGLYVCGALIYANRIPERILPGRFDYFFNSHQILHVCAVLAAVICYHCIQMTQKYRHSAQGQCVL